MQGLDATAARTFFSLRSGLERLGVELVLTHMPSTRYAHTYTCILVLSPPILALQSDELRPVFEHTLAAQHASCPVHGSLSAAAACIATEGARVLLRYPRAVIDTIFQTVMVRALFVMGWQPKQVLFVSCLPGWDALNRFSSITTVLSLFRQACGDWGM